MKHLRVWLVLLLCGCVDQPTQVLVRLATNIPDISTLVIRIFDDEEELVREQTIPPDRLRLIPDDGNYHQLGTFGLVPQDDDPNRRFRVAADITVSRPATIGTVRFETRARSGFVDGNTIRLDIYIAELCIELAAMCEEEGLTCGIDGCVPEDVPPESLPPIDEPVPEIPIDPRMFDAGVMDAGVDAPGVDVPGMDVPGVDAPGVDSAVDAPVADVGFPDVGPDTGSLDAGMLVPGVDPAPGVYPWNGFRTDTLQPSFAFRGVPLAVQHFFSMGNFPGSSFSRAEPTGISGDGSIAEYLLMSPLSTRRQWKSIVRSCTSGAEVDCNSPAVPGSQYLNLGLPRCDLDADGTSDIVLAEDDGTIRAWVDGPGLPPITVAAASGTSTVVTCADLDGDNDAELVTAASPSTAVRIFRWNAGSFMEVASPFSLAATTLATADFDADGFDDVAFADSIGGTVQVAFGTTGSLADLRTITRVVPTGVAAGRFGRDMGITDVNGDGFADLIITEADDRDEAVKTDSGFQVNYGDVARGTFATTGQPRPVPVTNQHFGWRVAGLGVEAQGRGVFVIAAPEADGGNTGGVWEYRQGLGAAPMYVPSPDMADGNCCFPNDLEPAFRAFGPQAYWVGYGDLDDGGSHRGQVYRCIVGAGCTPIAPPNSVDESFFGFDILGDLDGDRMVALGRAGIQNGAYVFTGAWTPVNGFSAANPLTHLAD